MVSLPNYKFGQYSSRLRCSNIFAMQMWERAQPQLSWGCTPSKPFGRQTQQANGHTTTSETTRRIALSCGMARSRQIALLMRLPWCRLLLAVSLTASSTFVSCGPLFAHSCRGFATGVPLLSVQCWQPFFTKPREFNALLS